MFSIFTSLLLSLWSGSLCLVDAVKTLETVHLLYRHGARAPLYFYPTDKYQEDYWKNGKAQLTQVGMNLEYDLGKFIKERYVNKSSFLNSQYVHKEVYIRSSDVDRCLQSAQCQLAGLYPPSGYQVWNVHIPWQPVPVHTVPSNDDALLRPHKNCPRLNERRKEAAKGARYIGQLKNNKELLSKVSNYTGLKINLENLWHITDILLAEKAEKLKLPSWALKLWKEMHFLSDQVFTDRYRGDDELGRLTGGPLLAKITKDMTNWSQKKLENLFKMNIYSAHDVTVLSLGCALDIPIDVPIFASCIIVELYKVDSEYVVEMQFRNDYSGNLKPLKLKGCSFSCPLDKFLKLTKNRISVNRDKECGKESVQKEKDDVGFFTYYNLKVLFGIFFVLSMFCLAILLAICYFKRVALKKRFCSGTHDTVMSDDDLQAFDVYT